jgi:nucleoside-diphosphate-sugar epimerase
MSKTTFRAMAAAFGAASVFAAGQAVAIPVALELSLLVDVSGSVDNAEYLTQRGGYAAAFRNPVIQALIASKPGGIAVNYIEWASGNEQSEQIAWTQITDAASADAFADALDAVARAFTGLTGPGSAINFAVPLFINNFEGDRQVIDVSGDGVQNSGADTSDARDAALAAGIDALNGLAIGGAGITAFYQNNIQGGTGSFTIGVSTFTDFPPAVLTKIGREITPVSEPVSIWLLACALGALAFMRRNRAG